MKQVLRKFKHPHINNTSNFLEILEGLGIQNTISLEDNVTGKKFSVLFGLIKDKEVQYSSN